MAFLTSAVHPAEDDNPSTQSALDTVCDESLDSRTFQSAATALSPQFLPYAYHRGRFVPFEQAQISIATHALHYGTAVLGGIRGWPAPDDPGKILLFRLEAHCQRLSRSAKYLGYSIDPELIQDKLIECVVRNRPDAPFYLRPLIYTAGLGVSPRLHDIEKDLLIYGLPMGDYIAKAGVRCRISAWCRQADRSQPLRGKLTASYIASALAKSEAIASGFDEAILMNSQGKVAEASAMNLFLVRNGALITPGFDQDILEGITRDSLLAIARDLNLPIHERPVDQSELFIADEVFLCGTATQVMPVLSIENYELPPQRPVTEQLKAGLQTLIEGRNPDYQAWLTEVAL